MRSDWVCLLLLGASALGRPPRRPSTTRVRPLLLWVHLPNLSGVALVTKRAEKLPRASEIAFLALRNRIEAASHHQQGAATVGATHQQQPVPGLGCANNFMPPLLTEFLLLATASGYTLGGPYAPTRQSPAVTPVMAQPAAAPVIPSTRPDALGIVVPTDLGEVVANGAGIQSLSTVPELEEAMAASQAAGRLCVVKFFAPWCSACRVIGPKFKRLARDYPEHDFYEVDFSRCKPLSKHCDITMLPTAVILEQGKLVEHAPIRRSDFEAFKGRLMGLDEAARFGAMGSFDSVQHH